MRRERRVPPYTPDAFEQLPKDGSHIAPAAPSSGIAPHAIYFSIDRKSVSQVHESTGLFSCHPSTFPRHVTPITFQARLLHIACVYHRNQPSMEIHALAEEGMLSETCHEELSIQEVIRRHHESLIKFLRRRLSIAEDANDVAQEAYIRMLKYEGSTEVKSASAMLFRSAVNVANDHGRAAQTRRHSKHFQVDDFELESGLPSAERTVAAEQDLDRLLDVIEGLPPKCRQVFLLSRARGMTYPEIARHCGISVKMVEKQISRALAVCLRKVGGDVDDTSRS
jgi:RNA polymerase sigma-70 factor (ECF subfamily)